MTSHHHGSATTEESDSDTSAFLTKPTLPPFPTQQMAVLCVCRMGEPIGFQALYAGMVMASFTLAEFSTAFIWGRISDSCGRKPCLIIGPLGMAISALFFGVAPSLPLAILARACGGFLNGNIGVAQTAIADIVPVKEHQHFAARGFSIMLLVWYLGDIVGPMLGAALARPCISYPHLFHPGTIWDRVPYLLPNLATFVIGSLGALVGFMFLVEPHALMKDRRDYGLEFGKSITSCISRFCCGLSRPKNDQKLLPTLDDEPAPGQSIDESTRLLPRVVLDQRISRALDYAQRVNPPAGWPEHPEPIHLPLRFLGGFGMDTKEIGIVLAFKGVVSVVSLILAFACIFLNSFMLYLTILPPSLRTTALYIFVGWKAIVDTTAYPSHSILLTDAAPSQSVLGTINGVAGSTSCFVRVIGPILAGYFFAVGSEAGYFGAAWWFCGLVAVAGALVYLRLTESGGQLPETKVTVGADGRLDGQDDIRAT